MPGIKLTTNAKQKIDLLRNYVKAQHGERLSTDQIIEWCISAFELADFVVVYDGDRLTLECRACWKRFIHGDAAVAHSVQHGSAGDLLEAGKHAMSAQAEPEQGPKNGASSVV